MKNVTMCNLMKNYGNIIVMKKKNEKAAIT